MMKKIISVDANSPKFGPYNSSKKGSSRAKESQENYIRSSGSQQP